MIDVVSIESLTIIYLLESDEVLLLLIDFSGGPDSENVRYCFTMIYWFFFTNCSYLAVLASVWA